MAALRFRASEAEAGRRLDQALAEHAEIGSRSLAERLIGKGAVRVGGARRSKSHRLIAGELVEVELPAERALTPEELQLPVVFEDEHLIVVDKPAGMVVHPVGSHEAGTLVHGLLALGAEGGDDDRPGIVHRLDRDTSGLLVVARSGAVHAALQDLVRARALDRRYLALVRGTPRSRTGRIEAPIGRDRRDRTRHSLDTPTPRDAVTWFETVELLVALETTVRSEPSDREARATVAAGISGACRNDSSGSTLREAPLGERTLLEVRLETGRTHQIRVHLEAIGLPVCGDPVYGVAGDLGLDRQFLHAHRLAFEHPVTRERVDVESPLPPDLAAALDRARGS